MKKLCISLLLLSWSALVFGQWTTIDSYPSMATDGAYSFVIGEKGYVGGGIAGNELYSFDPATGKWTELAATPSPGDHLAWAFSFTVDGKAYVGGGSYGSASDITEKMYAYDPATGQWTEKAAFPAGARDGFFSFSIGGKGYVGGGFDGQYMLNDFYEYDPATDQWEQLPNYPGGAVLFAAAFVINGKAYVGTGGQGSAEINDLWEFDPANDNWRQMASFPGESRQAAVGYAMGGKGYIAGGMSTYTTTRSDLWEYDPTADSWQKVQTSFPTEHLAWSTGFVIGNSAYFGLGVSFPDFEFSNAFYKLSLGQTGIDERKPADLKVFPNPATSAFNVEIPADWLNADLQILDVHGKTVKQLPLTNQEINIENLPAGLYFLSISNGAEVFRGKIIVR